MKAFRTKIRAIDPTTGELKDFEGKPIFADTKEDAEMGVRETQPYATIWSEHPTDSFFEKIINNQC